jgi:hypothetical protein
MVEGRLVVPALAQEILFNCGQGLAPVERTLAVLTVEQDNSLPFNTQGNQSNR